MTQAARQPATSALLARSPLALSVWAVVAAFGAYFCTYAFRKPWTAATFADATVWGVAEKSVLVVAQVLGYMLAKFVGIRVIAEMPPQRRAFGIVALIAGGGGRPSSCSASPRRRCTSPACSSTAWRWGWSSVWCSDFWRADATPRP